MTGKSFISMYMGTPQLDQLNDDLRAAEMNKEAPRLAVPQSQYEAMIGESWCEGGKLYRLVDSRESQSAISSEANLFEHSLGTFRLETGGLAYMVVLPSLDEAL